MDDIIPGIDIFQDGLRFRRFPKNPAYLVCEDGRIRRFHNNGWLKPCVLKRGQYLGVSLDTNGKGKTWAVHKVIAFTFHGEPTPPKNHAAHHDGDKNNNHKDNIGWKTKADNEADKILHGRTNRGERNGSAKLTNAQSREIKDRSKFGTPRGFYSRLSEEYGVSAGAIWNIVNGRRRLYD